MPHKGETVLESSLRKMSVFILAAIFAAAGTANAQATDRLARIIQAYGGAAALNRVAQVETEWAGYSAGRYQSRNADPPYDRVPVRAWSAFDLTAERSVSDNISTYPGELNLAQRAINDGARKWTLNTIARIYIEGSWYSHAGILEAARNRMPWMVAREMFREPSAFQPAGTREFRGIAYELLRRGDITYWVHPETSLIHAASWREESMVDVETDVMRTYTDHFEHEGVMVNRRQQAWAGGETTNDLELYAVRFNQPLDAYLRVPDGFLKVASMDGYNGVAKIGVERIGEGVFLAGDGETRVLYVEFDDHFAAMEAGGMPEYTEQTYRAMQPYMGKKPLRYVVPTHHHDDHAVAIHFYARVGATIVTTRDKEGFMRRLLARAWGDAPPVTNAKLRFIDGPNLLLQDKKNRLDVRVYADAPHAENMLVGYLGRDQTLYTCDVFIGWIGDVRQGGSHGAHHLARWVAAGQASGALGPVRNYLTCHGRPYSAAEFERMLSMERTIVALPGDEAWPSANWFERFGLADETARDSRRERVEQRLRKAQ